jgi:hypothetical protein
MEYIFLPDGSLSQLVPADRVIISMLSGKFTARILGDNSQGGGPKTIPLNGLPHLVSLEDGLKELSALAKPT